MKKVMLLVVGLFLGCGYYVLSYKTPELMTVEIIAPTQQDSKKMHKYRLNKLWRDKTAADLELNDGAIIHRYILNDDEYRMQLGLKLKEEAAEVDAAKDRAELTEEIGDVLEVLDCIIAFNNLDKEEIESIQRNKREKRGSYLAREYVTIAEAAPGSYLHNYYLKSPDRHQEIVD
ncbi:MAG: nucleoside triphosphate pyrophosphohydrolase [Candidatus Chromulinivorax sp.]|nr:nucleoside triphosphate pyrophosphohydrolase [Candidatus Chromulinivorax sp.]